MSTLPKGWEEATLLELAGTSGLMDDGDWIESKDQDPEGDVRLIQLADIGDGHFVDKSHRFLTSERAAALRCTYLQPGDLLIARMPDPLGRACIFPDIGMPAVTAVDVCIWRPSPDGANANWLMHFINSPGLRNLIQSQASGTTRQRVSGGNLKRTSVPVPPRHEQRRIVAKLDSLRARSYRARHELDRIPGLIERYKQAILAKAFSGELTATPFSDAITLSTCIKALDQGWSPKCETFSRTSDEKWAILKTTAVQSIHFDEHENKQLPPHLKPRPTIEVFPGDVLITRAGPRTRVGIACVVKQCAPRLILADKIYRLKVDASRTNPVWLALMLNSPQALAKIEEMKTGISDSGLNLTQGKLLQLRLPNADLKAQIAVVSLVEHAFDWLDKIATEHARAEHLLPKLDQAVLAKAFRGELVPQDPNDEPASALLERIKAASGGKRKERRRGRSPKD